MENWTERREGNILLIHNSTGSTVQVILEDNEHGNTQVMWLDYYEFENLEKAILKTKS